MKHLASTVNEKKRHTRFTRRELAHELREEWSEAEAGSTGRVRMQTEETA